MKADDDFQRIRARVIAFRSARGLTLQEAADRVGCTKSHVWEFERGNASNPTLRMLRGLADCYGVSLADLIGDDTSAPRLCAEAMAIAVQIDDAIRRAGAGEKGPAA